MNSNIRFAVNSDVPAILDIYNDAILNTTSVYDYEPHTLEMRELWLSEKEKANHPVLVAEAEGEIVGFASYGTFRPWAAFKYSMEHSVYVHPNHRGKGWAKRLLATLIAEAESRNVHTLIGGIDKENTVSLHLHQQMGFEEVGRIKEAGYKFEQWRDLVFMQLILNTEIIPNEEN